MTNPFLTASGIACSLVFTPPYQAAAQNEKKPNIVFVFADQLRADRVGYAGDLMASTERQFYALHLVP